MSAGAIRAGRAFVEMTIDDRDVQASLDRVKSRLKTFGSAVDAVGTKSFATMGTVATASTATTATKVGILAATMGVLRASINAVGVAFRSVFNYATTSVTKAIAVTGTLAVLVAKLAPNSRFKSLFDAFLSRSSMTEAVGRWTRFAGMLTGSSVFRDMGNRIERMGLGASIVKGFQNGLGSGLSATLGAAFRSTKSIIASSITGLVGAPFRMIRAGAGAAVGAVTGGGAASSGGAGQSAAIASGLTRATASGNAFGALSSTFARVASAIGGVALKVGGLAGAISGPALLAAKAFVNSAQEMIDKSKETGQALEELISEKYGSNSIVSKGDIESAAELSRLMKTLKQAMAAAWAQIGIAALPVLKSMTENMIAVATAVGNFLSQNREMITTVVTWAARIAGAAAAIGSLVAGFSAFAAMLPMIMSPLGMITIGVTALAYFFPQLRTYAMQAFEYLFGSFAELSAIVQTTMGGISDAIAGGDLMLAGRVLWAGLYALWLQGTARIRSVYIDMVTGLSGIFINLFAGVRKAWSVTTSFLLEAWTTVSRGVADIWTKTQNGLARLFARMIAGITGQNVDEVLATLNEMQNADSQSRKNSRAQADAERLKQSANTVDQIEKERQAAIEANKDIGDQKHKDAEDALKKAKEELDAYRLQAKELAANKKAAAPAAAANKEVATKLKFESETLSSFSTAGVGRTNIAGFSDFASMVRALEKIVDNTDPAKNRIVNI